MVTNLRSLNEHLLVRRCVVCGYDGALLRNGEAERCARCGCDLHERPARSYAEMEGLRQPASPSNRPFPDNYGERLRRRWMAFSVVVMMGVVAFLYLLSAALAV